MPAVDEAHNLVDRARAMFSADLEAGELRAVARQVRRSLPRCARRWAGWPPRWKD